MFNSPAVRRVHRVLLALLPVVLLLAATLSHNPAVRAAEGDLDPGFMGTSPGGFDNGVEELALQADGKAVIAGTFTAMNGTVRNRVARLHTDGSLDSSFAPGGGANDSVYAVQVQPDGKIVIGGRFTSFNGGSRNYIARLASSGALDGTFNPGSGANGAVYAVALQSDGKVLVGGGFTMVNGVARSYIARLNSDGSVDSSFAPTSGANGAVHDIAVQPDGKVLIGGDFTAVNGTARFRLARLNSDGSLDTDFTAGAGASVYAITLQADGKILLGGSFTAVNSIARDYVARLDTNGALDPDFAVDGGANSTVLNMVVQPDGKIVISGSFTTVDGITRNRIARLNLNGTLDPTFSGGGMNNSIEALALQEDGKLITGGTFTAAHGIGRSRIARLNASGSLDASYVTNRGANSLVEAIAVQSDRKIIAGGAFSTFSDGPHSRITRLQPDGAIDQSFNVGLGANNTIHTVAVQPDGKILIGGDFTAVNGIARGGIARLNPNGSLDEGFAIGGGTNGRVFTLALQPDAKMLIGGDFSTVNGTGRGSIARLNTDGSLDTSFVPGSGANSHVYTIALESQGSMVVGGAFTSVNGVSRLRLARLSPTGVLDPTFTTTANDAVATVAIQPDGNIVVGGWFSQLNGSARNRLGRLNPNGSVDTTFAPGGGATSTVITPFIETTKIQADGKILIGGGFAAFNGVGRNNIARINSNGSLDLTFAPSANAGVHAMALQPDGQLLISGAFTAANGVGRNYLARLQANGMTPPTSPTPDPSPAPGGPRVFLSRPQVTVGVNQRFQVDLVMDTDGRDVDTLDAYLDFDPTALEVIDAAGNPVTALAMNSGVFESATFNRVNNTTGQINLSASKYDAPFPNGKHTIAAIRFRAKTGFNATQIRFVQTGARQSDLLRAGVSLQPSFGNTIVRILNAPVLNGRVALEQRGPINTARWITQLFRTEGITTTGGIALYEPGTSTQVGQFAATTDQMGRFSVTLENVPVGSYDIQVKGANTLSNKRANIDLSDPTIEHDFGTLRVGDSTGNDTVNGGDVSYMVPSFLLTSSDPGFLPYADTNNNGAINGGDVSALVPNFLRSGPLTGLQMLSQPPQRTRAMSSATPQISLSPILNEIGTDRIVPVQVQVALGTAHADTLDLYLNFDPQLLEVVDAQGQPLQKLGLPQAAFERVHYNKVNNETGQINLSASRFDAPVTGDVAVTTFYVRAKQLFSTTAITVARDGARQSDLFAGGATLTPAISGGTFSMGGFHRAYVPSVLR